MDKRSRLELEGGGKSTNGTKEAALDKLRQMEWMRNKQDSWHLARSDSRKQEGYVKKKHNKDEDSYFEGTGSQKSKKVRKPRQAETSQAAVVSTGFTKAYGNSTPPSVNAWTQKKGSALFKKQSVEVEEVDEEDEMLKLVLKESLKTAEEDQRRHIERMKMNLEVMPTFQTKVPTRNDWKVEEEKCSEVQDQYSSRPSATNRELQFIDSDSSDDNPPPPSQRRKPPQSRMRKSSNPNEKPPAANINSIKPLLSHTEIPPSSTFNDSNNSFEPPRSQKICPTMGKTNYDQIKETVLKEPVVFMHKNGSSNVIQEDKSNITSVNNLSSDFSSNLTFGDTKSLVGRNYDNYNHMPLDEAKNFPFETRSYEPTESNRSKPILIPNSTSGDLSGYSENTDETDRIIHSFIRHDPPSSSDMQGSVQFYPTNNSQQYLSTDSKIAEQNQLLMNGRLVDSHPNVHDNSHMILKNSRAQDSSHTESNSSFQNISPYGSFGKETLSSLPQNVQQTTLPPFSFPYAANVQNNQEASSNPHAIHAATCNLPSHMTYGISPGYPYMQQTIRTVPPGLNQYGYPNTNIMVPPNVPNLSPQQLHSPQAMAMNEFQHQQTHLTGLETIHSEPNILQHQPKMVNLGDHQSQIAVSQNQLQMLQKAQLQMNSAVNQPIENTVQNPIELALETKQIATDQGIQQQNNKTREELQQEYLQAMQYINQLHQQLANTAPRHVIPEPQHYNYPCTVPMPIGNMYYSGVQMMPLPQQPLPNAVVTNPTGQVSPNFANLHSLLSTASGGVDSTQASSNLAIGRGRGRL